MFVPSSQVGRIIGKGGTNVRELQRLTGAIIKLPEQLSPPPKDETSVVIIGKWIQALVSSTYLGSQNHMLLHQILHPEFFSIKLCEAHIIQGICGCLF